MVGPIEIDRFPTSATPILDQIERRKGTILRRPLPWWALFPETRDLTEEFLVPNARLIAFLLAGSVVDLAGAQNFDFFELEPNNSCQAGTAFTVASGVGGGQLAGSPSGEPNGALEGVSGVGGEILRGARPGTGRRGGSGAAGFGHGVGA